MSAPARRFELDAKAERSVGRLRLVGAIIVFVCGGVLVARGAGAVGWTLVVMAWLVGLGWIAAFVRARRRVAGAGGHYLELGDALRMARGAAPVEVPWGEVDAVRVDEDRLVVVVERRAGPPLLVPPCWRGVGLYELAEAIRAAASGASPARPRPGTH